MKKRTWFLLFLQKINFSTVALLSFLYFCSLLRSKLKREYCYVLHITLSRDARTNIMLF